MTCSGLELIGLDLPILAGPSAINNNLLLAKLSQKGKSTQTAVDYYQKALGEDPWLWEAFKGMCDMGQSLFNAPHGGSINVPSGCPPAPAGLFPDPPATSSRAQSIRPSRPPTHSPNPMPRSSTSEVPFLPKKSQLSPLAPGPSMGFFTPDVGGGANGITERMGMVGMSTWE